MSPRLVIAAYRPRPGQEVALRALVEGHVPRLRALGLATDRPPVLMEASEGVLVEVFEWTSAEAIARAHEEPDVLALWAEFARVCTYLPLAALPEAAKPFAGFAPLDAGAELGLCIDHTQLSVADLDAARAFYGAALAPLGIAEVGAVTAEQSGSVAFVGYGRGRKGALWIAGSGRQTPTTHLCFRTATRAQVRAFHAAALVAGGTDNGAPGVREHYHPAYYAAFVRDPEGHNVEAVTFAPELA